jgi:hypothetical protein
MEKKNLKKQIKEEKRKVSQLHSRQAQDKTLFIPTLQTLEYLL